MTKTTPVIEESVSKLPPMANIAVSMEGNKATFTIDMDKIVGASKSGKFDKLADTRGFIHFGDLLFQVQVMKKGSGEKVA